MKKNSLHIFTAFILGFCFLNGMAQKKVIHISQLEEPGHFARFADVAGYILISDDTPQPVQHQSFRNDIVVMEGWPAKESGASNRGGIYGNLDSDEEMEIIFNMASKAWAFNMDGTVVDGWPVQVSSSAEYGAPAYGDIDGDGYNEIVVSCRQPGTGNTGRIYAFERDGTPLDGFPIIASGGPTRTPVLADLEMDGTMEIIVELRDYPDGYVCVYKGDGTVKEGWPQMMDYIPASSVAVGDITGDDVPEIVAESYYKVWAFDTDGSTLEGFPYIPPAGGVFSYSSPVLADFDDDGFREIVVGDHTLGGGGAVHIIKNDGSSMDNWPRYTQNWIYGPPSVGDIDGNGSLDVAIGDQILSGVPTDYVYAWDISGTALDGFPIGPIWAVNSQIILADLDGDAMLELMFDDNTGEGIFNGYNHDGTMMDGWPLEVEGSTFFQNPFVFDIEGNGTLNITGSSYDSNMGETRVYLWETGVAFDDAMAVLPILQYNVRHTGVYGEKGNPVVNLGEIVKSSSQMIKYRPNPCANETRIYFDTNDCRGEIRIYNSGGRLVKTVLPDRIPAASGGIILSTQDLQPGVYMIKIEGMAACSKLVVTK